MSRSLQEFLHHRGPLRLTILAGMLLGSVYACSRSTTTSQAQPQVTPQEGSREVRRRPRESLAAMLQGRTSGVTVTETPTGEIAVRMNGAASFYGDNAPLYVVDGIPIRPGPGGVLRGINPEDIESIEVLKPPDTALYGVRGANGVVVIKTKQPGR